MDIYYVYTKGKFVNKCWIKYSKTAKEAKLFYDKLGYDVIAVYKA